MNSDIKELNKNTIANVHTIPEEYISSEKKSYEDFWDMLPFQYGIGPPENYPAITHKDVVHRALERKKPFKDDGKDGYRDYLIWLTLNTRDFPDPINKKELHPQLKKILKIKELV